MLKFGSDLNPKRQRLLLVGWDAADWKILNPLVERGEMPVFSQMLNQGVMGDLTTLDPPLSPLLWNSVSTGKRADQHGIVGFTDVDSHTGRVRPVSSVTRRVKALWNILGQRGLTTNVVGWFGSHPAEPVNGICVSDAFARGVPPPGHVWPWFQGTAHPASFEDELKPFRLRPDEIDEATIRMFVPRLDEIDRSQPNGLWQLANILSEAFTTHNAATWAMTRNDWDFMAVYYIAIDHFSHAFMNFHPPKLPGLEQKTFEIYRDVVNSGYRLMDLFLARLLALAGPDTAVLICSDHGFHSDHLRPVGFPEIPTGPALHHRGTGMFAMAGPGICRDERIYGMNLLDIAPTVLGYFGLPAGADMPGRVIAEAFENPPQIERVPSWEQIPGPCGMHPEGTVVPPDDSDRLIEQFVALGYIEPLADTREEAAASCLRENKWNLARVYTGSHRWEQALPLLEELHEEAPERPDMALALANCQMRVGLYEEAEATARSVIPGEKTTPRAQFVLGQIAFERGRYREAAHYLLQSERAHPRTPGLWVRIGFAQMRLRRWRQAERAFRRALAIDPQTALAHQGLGRVLLRLGRFEEAANAALDAVVCRHDVPMSHFLLGAALLRLGDRERAIQAFETSLHLHQPFRLAHRVLAGLYGDTPEGQRHREAAAELLAQYRSDQKRLEFIRQQARHRAIDRAELRTKPAAAADSREFVIVSGLPRSGTSLMMRMLAAGGLPPMTDGQREADIDNPEGYFEWEAIRRIGAEPELLKHAEGKAIKVISMLLPQLPVHHNYRLIFMDRPVQEVAQSQAKMMARRGTTPTDASLEDSIDMLHRHREDTLNALQRAKRFSVLVVDYPSLVHDPEAWLGRIAEFVGGGLDTNAMRAAIREDLYRNRA